MFSILSKNKLGRLYNPGRPLAMEERQKILHLHKKGYKISYITRIIGLTHSCVSKIMARYQQTGSMQPHTISSSKRRNTDCSSGMIQSRIIIIRNCAETVLLMLLRSSQIILPK
ncbi:Paired box protein [Dirofilaria immitis]